jgi:hypothetical protein
MSGQGHGAPPDHCAEALYRRYQGRLRAWLAGRVSASPALVEDACASAWLTLVAKPPLSGERVFGWLCTVALHVCALGVNAPDECSSDVDPAHGS